MVTNRRAHLSRRSAIQRLKDSAADLLLPDFHFSPVAFLSQGWSLQLNDRKVLFLHKPHSEDRLCAYLGTEMLAF